MSTIKVDRIEPRDGLQTNAMGGIVQVVRVVHTGQVSSNSTSYVSTGLQASITPRSASNKIMVSFEHSIYHTTQNSDVYTLHGIRIKRGTQVIYTPVTSNSGNTSSSGPYEFGLYHSHTTVSDNYYHRSRVEYLDSPGTAGALLTYSTELSCFDSQGVVYSNYNSPTPGHQTSAPQSWMTLIEITA